MFTVTVYFLNADQTKTLKTDKTFSTEAQALRYINNETSYEYTRRVVCKELSIDQDGDYEFTR